MSKQRLEKINASDLTLGSIRLRAGAFNHVFDVYGGYKGYEVQAIDSLLSHIDSINAQVEAMRELLGSVDELKHSEAFCHDVDGNNWFDLRDEILKPPEAQQPQQGEST